MSNQYGFDFLRTEHLDESAVIDTPKSAPSGNEVLQPGSPGISEELFLEAQNKPALEKQFDILNFLQKHREAGGLAPSVIYKSTGIDLEVDTDVANMLQKNPKVNVERWPDPENPSLTVPHYSYQATYSNVRDRASLLAQINREFNGVPVRDLLDSYPEVGDDISALVTAGDIIAIQNTEDKDKILFPRGEPFLVELDGLIAIPKPPGTTDEDDKAAMPPPVEVVMVETDVDPRPQIRRGEAVQVGGQWFRVSSAVKAGVPLSEQPSRAQAPLSVVSLVELSKRNEVDGYIRPFNNKILPVDAPLSEEAQSNIVKARAARERLLRLAHGRSGGVTGQILGSHAHASNPTALAASFAGSTTSASMRKRPTAKANAASHKGPQVSKEELEKAAADEFMSKFRHARRHGCTTDIREMYLKTRSLVPETDKDLKRLLVANKLMEENEELRPKRMAKASNVDQQGKPKKRRYYERKNQRWTNTHLEGTEIGAVLALAQEKQKQGKSVGDGGMVRMIVRVYLCSLVIHSYNNILLSSKNQ